MSKKTFIKGAAILGTAGILVKVLGALFRIPLGNMLSESAMAYYQPAYHIYTFFLVIATSGIPVAISRMVSEQVTVGNYREAHRIFKISMYLMCTLGIISFSVLFFLAEPISNLIHSPNTKYPMMVIAPALVIVPVMAAFRGYFQGVQNMRPTAVSQVFEQFFRVAVGLSLAYVLYNSSGELFGNIAKGAKVVADVKGASGAISGATVGSLAGLIIIVIVYAMNKKAIHLKMIKCRIREKDRASEILKKILVIAVPITIGAAIMPIMNMIEVPIINNRLLSSGWSIAEADKLYGIFSGYIMSLVNLPQVLTAALAMSIVPLIASVFKERDFPHLRYNTTLAMRLAMIIGLPCGFGMAVLARPIMLLLYPAKPEIANTAADCLVIMAVGVVFLSIIQTLAAVLQGVGRQMVPVFNLIIGIVIKVVLTYALVGIPELNIRGAAIGTVVAYMVVAVLDIRATKRVIKTELDVMLCYIKPGISAAIMGLITFLTYTGLMSFLGYSLKTSGMATLIAIGVGGTSYVILLLVTKSLGREDLIHLPKGEKIVKIYDKLSRGK